MSQFGQQQPLGDPRQGLAAWLRADKPAKVITRERVVAPATASKKATASVVGKTKVTHPERVIGRPRALTNSSKAGVSPRTVSQ